MTLRFFFVVSDRAWAVRNLGGYNRYTGFDRCRDTREVDYCPTPSVVGASCRDRFRAPREVYAYRILPCLGDQFFVWQIPMDRRSQEIATFAGDAAFDWHWYYGVSCAKKRSSWAGRSAPAIGLMLHLECLNFPFLQLSDTKVDYTCSCADLRFYHALVLTCCRKYASGSDVDASWIRIYGPDAKRHSIFSTLYLENIAREKGSFGVGPSHRSALILVLASVNCGHGFDVDLKNREKWR